MNLAVLISWGIQMGLDVFVYPLFKVGINFGLIKIASGKSGSSKKICDFIIDQHIAEAFDDE